MWRLLSSSQTVYDFFRRQSHPNAQFVGNILEPRVLTRAFVFSY